MSFPGKCMVFAGLLLSFNSVYAEGASDTSTVLASSTDTSKIIREKLESSNLSRAPGKVGFSGYFLSRVINHEYTTFPLFLSSDANRSTFDADFNLRVIANPNPYAQIWSMVSFGYDFSGHFLNSQGSNFPRQTGVMGFVDTLSSDASRSELIRDKNRDGVTLFEDMMAGMDIKTAPFAGRLRMGSAMWMDGSPFTIWKRDPRPRLAWYFESYELELSSANYYAQKLFYKRVDQGRLTWPKKSYGGIHLDAYKMPGGVGMQLFFSQPVNMLPTKPDGNALSHTGDPEGLTSLNNIGDLFYGRLSKTNLVGRLTPGANVLMARLPEDIYHQVLLSPNSPQAFRYQFQKNDTDPWYVDPTVLSLDIRGDYNAKLYLHADIAFSYDDTTKFVSAAHDSLPFEFNSANPTTHARGKIQPAAYLKVSSRYHLPVQGEIIWVSKNFWSPYSMTEYIIPVRKDMMKLGAGNQMYQSNLMGLNLSVSPRISGGYLVIGGGQHAQVSPGRDLIRFQHRLNGRDVWAVSTSWSKSEPGRLFEEGGIYNNPNYSGRLGDLGPDRNLLHLSQEQGGLRGDDLELWEEFAAYDNKAQADTGDVPVNRKWSTAINVEFGYDISGWLGYDKTIMLAFYTSSNSIGKDLLGIMNTDNTLLWSSLFRFQPGMAITPKFHIIGLFGVETWQSEKAWKNDSAEVIKVILEPNALPILPAELYPPVDASYSPIDYLQFACGLGFDWDYSSRAGLHVRFKYATHEDKNISDNNWNGYFIFAETKIWY